MFGALSAARDLTGTHVLDLYAGTGAVGIEACSRGAESAVFIESHTPTAQLLRRNLATLGLTGSTEVLTGSLPGAVARPAPRAFDIVFADPPYALDNATLSSLLNALCDNGWIAEDADVIIERASRSGAPQWPDGLAEVRSRRYGESTLWYGRPSWT